MNANKDRFYVIVGERLREMREESGLSQRQLAEASGVSASAIDSAEDGVTCSLYALARFAEALDATLDDLVPVDALMVAKEDAE